jgi:FeS assembly protein IscX
MQYEWSNINDIAIELSEKFPDIDPQWINFPDLHKKIIELDNFIGDPNKSNEKILEAIQQSWIDEFI